MATDVLTIYLEEDGKIKGKDLDDVSDEDNNQIVTFLPDGDDFEGGEYEIAFFGKGTPTEPGAGPGGDDVFQMDLSLFDDDFSFVVKSVDAGDIFDITGWDSVEKVGTVYTFTFTGSDGLEHTFSIDAQSENGDDGVDVVQVLAGGNDVTLVCFARDTAIETESGPVPIQTLREGDLVKCGDGQLRPICWIGARKLNADDLARNPNWYPIRFHAGAMGGGFPARDLYLSPQHGVLLHDWRAELLFGDNEVFVPAKHLVNDLTIRPDTSFNEIEYFHILLDEHHTVLAEGMECESLCVEALRSGALNTEARDEILGLFPELAADLSANGEAYRQTLRRYEAEALLNTPLFA